MTPILCAIVAVVFALFLALILAAAKVGDVEKQQGNGAETPAQRKEGGGASNQPKEGGEAGDPKACEKEVVDWLTALQLSEKATSSTLQMLEAEEFTSLDLVAKFGADIQGLEAFGALGLAPKRVLAGALQALAQEQGFAAASMEPQKGNGAIDLGSALGEVEKNFEYFAFLSHHKKDAALTARVLKIMIEGKISGPGSTTFLDSDNLHDLRVLIGEVKKSMVVILIQTKDVLCRPWCIVEIYTAIELGIPIIPINVDGKGWSFERFYDIVAQSESRDPAERQPALDGIAAVEKELGMGIAKVMAPIRFVVPRLISKQFSEHASASVQGAQVGDIVDACIAGKRNAQPFDMDLAGEVYKSIEAEIETLHDPHASSRRAFEVARAKGLFEKDIDELRDCTVQLHRNNVTRTYTPLIFAARTGNMENVVLLTTAGADLKKQNPNGASCIYVAASYGHLDVIKYLVEKGGRELLMIPLHGGRSSLLTAADYGQLECVKYLAEVGGEELIMMTTEDGYSCLHIAALKGHLAISKHLVEVGGQELLGLILRGKNAHGLAIEKGHATLAAFLASASAGCGAPSVSSVALRH